jgi:hypothetical protein
MCMSSVAKHRHTVDNQALIISWLSLYAVMNALALQLSYL